MSLNSGVGGVPDYSLEYRTQSASSNPNAVTQGFFQRNRSLVIVGLFVAVALTVLVLHLLSKSKAATSSPSSPKPSSSASSSGGAAPLSSTALAGTALGAAVHASAPTTAPTTASPADTILASAPSLGAFHHPPMAPPTAPPAPPTVVVVHNPDHWSSSLWQSHNLRADDTERVATPEPYDPLRYPASYLDGYVSIRGARSPFLGPIHGDLSDYDGPTRRIMTRPNDPVGPWERTGFLVGTVGDGSLTMLPLFIRRRDRGDRYDYRTTNDGIPIEIATRTQMIGDGDPLFIRSVPQLGTLTVQLYEDYR